MRGHDEERCPSCGSEKIALQGRLRDGTPVRELVCIACKHVWPVDLPALDVT
jgi:DNA-directed RNA polymerase subunit M/transcription elongation factor TFIIS